MNNAKLFLNKVINENNYSALTKYNISLNDMINDIDRNTYKFIVEYATHNNGNTPSYALVTSEVEGYEYVPEVTDSYLWLAHQIKSTTAKQEVLRLFEDGEFEEKLNTLDGREFVDIWLRDKMADIAKKTHVNEKVGTDIKDDSSVFMEEYTRRKIGESFKIWKSKYSSVGEYYSGNLYTVIGESGRGKSVLSLDDVIYMAQQGANVLIYSLEMGWYETMVRIYTSLSSDIGIMKATFEGVDMDVGFNSYELRTGKLGDRFEEEFNKFLKEINSKLKGNITLRAVDDEDFIDRSLRQLESDILATDADVVMIDPFYYLTYERNEDRTTGGAAASTSRKLRALTGRLGVVTIAITQADVHKKTIDDDGTRELRVPEREDVRSTMALLEDAAILIGIDSDYKQGYAIVANLKARDGGEDGISNVIYLPQYGVIKELEVGEGVADEFDF